MDLYRTIKDLQNELKRINHLIAVLEEMQKSGSGVPSRRGRKAMSETERREVSDRMKAYWAAKRREPRT